MTTNRIWSFKTKNFLVVCDAEPEDFDGFYMDEDDIEEVERNIRDGTLTCFCAHVSVHWNGMRVADEYLGDCVHADPREFLKNGYFPGMVTEACRMARDRINILMSITKLRKPGYSLNNPPASQTNPEFWQIEV